MQFQKQHFEMALSYNEYDRYAENLLTKISSDDSNSMQQYANVNLNTIQQLRKSVHLTKCLLDALSKTEPLILVILTEGYCGDSAQTLAVFEKMQELFPEKIEIKIILRDKNLVVADNYFETRAIPTIIGLSKTTLEKKFSWGNRPEPAQKLMTNLKIKSATPLEKSKALHKWYAQDDTQTLQREIAIFLTDEK